MSLVVRLGLLEPEETWPGMALAADERFWDGFVLAVSETPRRTAAVYLLGYTAEMLLKVAYFRFIGVPPQQELGGTGGPLAQARTHARWQGRNLHDLSGWLNLLLGVRELQGRPMDPIQASSLRFHVLTIDAHWRETLRYRYTSAAMTELAEVYAAVEWLRSNHPSLWS